ncbi:hypothetical protein AB0N99_30795 [Streptomyces sp. NPDC093272]|uniref:hypothetical protein n=1 Tax=Streptomyces sp. NPDC093272 TaxID=3154981 RepID=UPI003442B08E
MGRRDWNPLYTLRWDTAAGEQQITGTSRDIHAAARRVNQLGDLGTAWDIAVLDEGDVDVTARFFDHLDR